MKGAGRGVVKRTTGIAFRLVVAVVFAQVPYRGAAKPAVFTRRGRVRISANRTPPGHRRGVAWRGVAFSQPSRSGRGGEDEVPGGIEPP